MIPVLKQEEPIHYVSEASIVAFVNKNSNMDWNKCCDYIRDIGFCSWEGQPSFWDKKDIFEIENEEERKWANAFFEAHPWINKMMIVFDD